MRKRPLTPAYVFFLILFWPDTWRIAAGFLCAALLTPRIVQPHQVWSVRAMLFVMLASIGYAASAPLGRGVARFLRNWFLAGKH